MLDTTGSSRAGQFASIFVAGNVTKGTWACFIQNVFWYRVDLNAPAITSEAQARAGTWIPRFARDDNRQLNTTAVKTGLSGRIQSFQPYGCRRFVGFHPYPHRGFERPRLRLLFSAAHLQIGADERLQIAVDYPIHIADLHLGAMIFDETIRLQDIRANLRAEVDVEF
jgi:hypothetical protein